MADQDLAGNDLTAQERELLEIYRRIRALSETEDLAPCVAANLEEASTALFNALNDLLVPLDPP